MDLESTSRQDEFEELLFILVKPSLPLLSAFSSSVDSFCPSLPTGAPVALNSALRIL